MNKKTRTIKLGLLIFLITVLLHNCKEENFTDNYEENFNSRNSKIENFSFNQIQLNDNFINLLNKFKIDKPKVSKKGIYISKITHLNHSLYSKSAIEDLDIPIDMSKIVKITTEDYTSYTMRVIKYPEDTTKIFYNVVLQQKNEIENLSFIKYTPSENFIEDQTGSFEGQIELTDGGCLQEMMIGIANPCDENAAGGAEGGNNFGEDWIEICHTISTYIRTPCGYGHLYLSECSGSPIPPTYPGGFWEDTEDCYWLYVGYGNDDNYNSSDGSYSNGGDIFTGSSPSNPNSPVTSPTIGNIITSPIIETDDAVSIILSHMSNLSPTQIDWLNTTTINIQNIILSYLLENNYDTSSQNLITECINSEINLESSFIAKFKLEREYAKITRLFEFSPTYKQALINLSDGIENSTEEKGLYVLKNNNVPQSLSANGSDNINFPYNPLSLYISLAHIHDALGLGNGTFSIYSFADLLVTSSLVKKFKIKTNKFVSFLVTAKGTRYAFTISSPSKFRNNLYNALMDYAPDGKVDMIKVRKTGEISKEYYTKKDSVIKVTNTDNDQVLIAFLQMIKEFDLGITLFQVSADFETYTQVSLDTDNTTIIYTPLN